MSLLDILPGPFKKTGSDEWHGPCPSCGGKDRCIVTASKNLYWCRQCNEGGDVIEYLRTHHSMRYREAARHAGKPLDEWTDTKAAIARLGKRREEARADAVREGLLQTLRAKAVATEREWGYVMAAGSLEHQSPERALDVASAFEEWILTYSPG